MAIRNTCYNGATNWCDGNVLCACDLNDTFDATYNTTINMVEGANSISLENAMNIAKLQYCSSVADIAHDYMVIDVMTDSTGYNNTISSTLSNSAYTSTGLDGYYLGTTTSMTWVRTVTLSYSSSVCKVYALTENYGSGTIVYDVYDSNNTSTALSTSLSLNTLYSVISSTSHVYVFKQCTDAVSCIKSYAVVVGKV